MKIILAVAIASMLIPPAAAQTAAGTEANRILKYISDSIISGKVEKPVTRTVMAPARQSPELQFKRQMNLTPDLIDRYLGRAISHFLPWDKPERSRQFLQDTGTKYIHWSHLLWGQSPPDWGKLAAEIDIAHGSEWGSDVVFEAGVMEIISRPQADNAVIPDWLYKCMEELGVNKTRKPGPNGARYFSYENMFDRNADDWDKGFIGRWSRDKNGVDTGSVPDITMVETQLWYAYLITEYIDAGFEGIFFGQIGLTAKRDKDNECTWEMSLFAKRLAAARAYRRAVFLSTHHYCVPYRGQLDPDSPKIFTHMTWPSRLFYSDKNDCGMETGLNATEDGQHATKPEFKMLIEKPPFDLPILIEIDNYGNVGKGNKIAADPEGNDEITAYMKKPHEARACFLRKYYHEFQTYKNKAGKQGRVHLAPSGERMGYMPYKEDNGEEDVVKELFAEAAAAAIADAAKPPAPPALPKPAEAKTLFVPYSDIKRNFAVSYPANAKFKDKSAEMKPKSPSSIWLEFSVDTGSGAGYVINVRRAVLAKSTTPEEYAATNKYLSSWQRVTINGLSGFVTGGKEADSNRVTHRTILLDDKSVWMLNLIDSSGGDAEVTKKVFDRVVGSLNVKGIEPIGGRVNAVK